MSNIIKSSKTLRLAILSAGLILGMAQQSAFAAGTLSNTDINNIAKLSYTVGGVAQNEICSSSTAAGNNTSTGTTSGSTCTSGANGALNTTFKVDNKVNLTVIEKNAAATIVVPGTTGAITTFTVTNNGNTVQDYSLVANSAITGGTIFTTPAVLTDNFDASNCAVFVEVGPTAGYQVAEDTATFIDDLAPDLSKDVYVKCDIAVSRINNDVSIIELTATTLVGGAAGQGVALTTGVANTQSGVEIVLADLATPAGGDGTLPLQVAGDGKGTARDAFKVESAVLAVSKVVTPICDPINAFAAGPKNIPGAAVQYAITISNSGLAPATLATITDTLDTNIAALASAVAGGAASACVPSPALASGFGAVVGTVTTGASPVVTSNYVAPGVAAQATTAGATVSGQVVTINYPTLATGSGLVLPAVVGPPALAAGTLAAGAAVTVYFNVFIK
jgi:uncharacterized repeat protein (TIGR01451 family)